MTEKEAKVYAMFPFFQHRVRQTKVFIEEALTKCERPYVACSFGKDSSVMLDLVRSVRPEILVKFATHPETYLLDDYQRVVNWWIEHKKIKLEDVFCEGGLIKVKHHQRNRLSEGNYDAFFVGIRAEESKGRRISLKKYGDCYRMKNGILKISPMAWWKEADISAYMYAYGLPVLDKYEFEGTDARTTSGIPRTNLRETLTSLRNRDLQKFNELLTLYPDAADYI